jgi:hypothetical protein
MLWYRTVNSQFVSRPFNSEHITLQDKKRGNKNLVEKGGRTGNNINYSKKK